LEILLSAKETGLLLAAAVYSASEIHYSLDLTCLVDQIFYSISKYLYGHLWQAFTHLG
jgi:hypothetical protein